MITVDGLVSVKSLGLHYLAGLAGGHRLVTWAHAVDLPDPWRWISPGNLIMTVGSGMPQDPAAQVIWLTKLVDANTSALVVARKPDAPAITTDLLAEAERRLFPVLEANFELEFVKLSRIVMESVLQAERDRFESSQRLFQIYTSVLRDASGMSERLEILAQRLDLSLQIEDSGSGIPLTTNKHRPSDLVGSETLVIPGRSRACLRVWGTSSYVQDAFLSRSLIGLLSVELERHMIERDRARGDGEVLLRDLAEGASDYERARPILERRGLGGVLVAVAIQPAERGEWRFADLHHAPELNHLSPLFSDNGVMVMVLPDRTALIEALVNRLGSGSTAGVSGPVTQAGGLAESIRQARLTLSRAPHLGGNIHRYAALEGDLTLAPKTVAEARAIVSRYLGPLISYDEGHTMSLLQTLATFLAKDGSWKAASAELGIHRQTLIYRLRLIEDLTGLKANTSSGTARFWTAIHAGISAGLLDEVILS